MEPGECPPCGETDWVDGTDEDYTAALAEMRKVAPDARAPDRVEVCRNCGRRRIVLTMTFDPRQPGPG